MKNKIIAFTAALALSLIAVACGGGGGGSSSTNSGSNSGSGTTQTLSKVMDYQNEHLQGQVFNYQVADLNNDGLEDVVVSGWSGEPSGYTGTVNGRVPVKILIQQTNGTLLDSTASLLGAGNEMIYGSQRVLINDFDNDGRLDIFLPGFQDGGLYPLVPSVMFWNTGVTFTRQDFTEPVYGHAACTYDLLNSGKLDIIIGASTQNSNDIYINNGNRSFSLNHSLTNKQFGTGACSVFSDPSTGNIGILNGNTGNALAGYNSLVYVYNSNMAFQQTKGLPGSEQDPANLAASHDDVNFIQMDLNGDGLTDILVTDNRYDNNTGYYKALINSGNFNFSDQTSTYFPNQLQNKNFGYNTRSFDIGGYKSIFTGASTTGYMFDETTKIYRLINGSFVTYLDNEVKSAIGSYKNPMLYQGSNGKLYVLLSKEIVNGNVTTFEFYTRNIN